MTDTKTTTKATETELTDKEASEVTGGAIGSFSWRAFNPQPEPPRTLMFSFGR